MLAYLLFPLRADAQLIVSRFAHRSLKDGLSHNSVNCIFQDREGYMWFGTNDGLNRYDGQTFTIFRHDPARQNASLRHNLISGLCEDAANRLWVCTEGGGLHEVDKRTGAVTPHPIGGSLAHRWNSQQSIYGDRQGLLWISSFQGLIRYDPNRHHFSLYPYATPQRETSVKSVFEDRQGRLWVATTSGLNLFDRRTGRFRLVAADGPASAQPWYDAFFLDAANVLWLGTVGQGLYRLDLNRQPLRPQRYNPGGQINRYVFLNAVQGDNRGLIWVGTSEGLQRVDTRTGAVETFRPDPKNREGISSINAQAVYQDRAHTLWIGTDYGVDQLPERIKQFDWYQVRPNTGAVNLLENKTNTLLIDKARRLWSSNQFDLYRREPPTQQISQIPQARFGSGLVHKNYVYAMQPDPSGDVWLATWDALYRYRQGTNEYVAYPSSIACQLMSIGPTGTIWLGGEGGVAAFDPRTNRYTYYLPNPTDSTGLPGKFVYALLASRTGEVWISVNGKGISRLDPRTGRFRQYHAGQQPGQLNSSEVLTFYEDADGIIWIGTSEGGLNRVDPGTGRFSHVTSLNGLPSNRVVGILGDKRGRLWLSTSNGLCRFDPRTNTLRSYDTDDGLPSNDFLENATFRQPGALYFGSMNGILGFNPDSVRDDTRPFPVSITGLKLLDRNRPLTDSIIQLRYNENFLSLEFVALTYVLPEQNQYTYQLVGIDDQWVRSGTRRTANYTKLPPGDYRFRVRAANSDGVWTNREASLHIVIHPPWWQTWWAYMLYGLLLVGVVWGIIAYRSRQLIEANRLLEETVVIRTTEVSRQRNELARQRDNLERTLTELTDTQNQLIQKEKMASLGELTAGIAHEIQNPLNFVNNFSDLSVELAAELAEEVAAGNQDTALELTAIIQENLTKIANHGHRADAIVKGMLQHARSSTGEKEPTQLSRLTNEYLRLAYHGLRAKDSTFNVELVVNMDSDLPPITVIPQEIGRVLLNLFTNAFYSMAEKQKQFGNAYQAVLTVAIRGGDQYQEVRIRDNGLGIPKPIIDKILQPFFTTKPTGEGTGLGLSLSYDIIAKVHRGRLLVDTREGDFAEFCIQLPTALNHL